jgi:hypothetical protein
VSIFLKFEKIGLHLFRHKMISEKYFSYFTFFGTMQNGGQTKIILVD